ncbi:hypothetical protein FD755_013274 [Muntiacus reevesi]|uniref:ribulose-phosphate 3-epimerase n=1 Tax=Muntiacus reevesi TaxID=9886 RepID=A0A5N3XNE8_MUNRE|nr:hypothetical protein FD755_013274 [Muntiacus reevesi]
MLESEVDYLHLDVTGGLQKQQDQDPFFDMYMKQGANQCIFHLEATENPGALVKDTQNRMKAGIAIKPGTTAEYLAPWANQIDIALVMTVEPGFGEQKFMEDTMPKAGANIIMSGGAIMRSEDPRSVINLLRNVCSEADQKHSLDQ